MSLAAATAKVWYLAIYVQILQKYAEENVKASQQQLEISIAQFNTGKAEQQDVDLAQSQLAQNQAQFAQLTDSYLQIVRGLETLLGRYPSAELKTAVALAALPPPVPAGLPAQLLERRPDVMAAEYSFDAAFHLVQTAKAARLPSLNLTGGGGYTTNAILQDLRYKPWVWTAAGNVLAPIYTGGYLQAQVKIANQNQKAALALYGQTVLQAFDDVEVTLTNERYLKEEEKDATEALKSTEDALSLASVKYNIGQTDLSPVLQLETVVSSTQMAIAYVQQQLIANRINLYHCIGRSILAASQRQKDGEELASQGTARRGAAGVHRTHEPRAPGCRTWAMLCCVNGRRSLRVAPSSSSICDSFSGCLAGIFYANGRFLSALFRVLHCDCGSFLAGQVCVHARFLHAFAGVLGALHGSVVRVLDGVLGAVSRFHHHRFGRTIHTLNDAGHSVKYIISGCALPATHCDDRKQSG